jgi:hypothetical protein
MKANIQLALAIAAGILVAQVLTRLVPFLR